MQPLELFRPLDSSNYNKLRSHDETRLIWGEYKTFEWDDIDHDNKIHQKAHEQSLKEDSKTALTVMLEDFTELVDDLEETRKFESVSYIDQSDMKGYSWIERLFNGKNCNNIFKDDEVRQSAARGFRKPYYDEDCKDYSELATGISGKRGCITQQDIYQLEIYENGGLRYSDENDNINLAALNFAKADFGAIEKAYSIANKTEDNINGKLTAKEFNSYLDTDLETISDMIKTLNLDDDDKTISSQEYAAYILAVDSNQDGLLTAQEVEWANENFKELINKKSEEDPNLTLVEYYYQKLEQEN